MPVRAGFGVNSTTISTPLQSLAVLNKGTSLSSLTQNPIENCATPTTTTTTSPTPMEDMGSRIEIYEISQTSKTSEHRRKRRWSAES